MKRAWPGAVAVGVFVVAVLVRWQQLPVASALGDAVGPWWVAARGGLLPTPHAPPYGQLLALPYRALLLGAGSLWSATAGLFVLHAAVAPLATFAVARSGGGPAPAALAGLALALSPGLLDTATSGAETYLAPVWVAAMALAVACRRPALAGLAWLAAVHNHPLALSTAPLLLALPWTRRSGLALIGPALLLPHVVSLVGQPVGVGGGGPADPLPALWAWIDAEGPGAGLVGVGLAGGLWLPARRRMALATAASLGLLLLLGGALGYLRDHHLRMLMAPAMVGLAGACVPRLGSWGVLVLLPLLRLPGDPVQRPAQGRRPGTHGLLAEAAPALLAHRGRPLAVDGVWLSSSPALEPGAVLLDLHLRGAGDLDVGGDVALVVSAERAELADLPPGLTSLHGGDRHRVLVGDEPAVTAWLGALCASRVADGAPAPRLGGAFDGLVPLHPGLPASRVAAWTAGCAP